VSASCPTAAISFHSNPRAREKQSSTRSSWRNRAGIARLCSERRARIGSASFFFRRSVAGRSFFYALSFLRIGPLLPPSPGHSRCLCSSLHRDSKQSRKLARRVGTIRAIKEPPRHATHPRASHPAGQRHRRRRRRRQAGNKRGRAANRHRPLHFSTSFAVRVRGPILDQACRSALARGEKKKRGDGRGCRAGTS